MARCPTLSCHERLADTPRPSTWWRNLGTTARVVPNAKAGGSEQGPHEEVVLAHQRGQPTRSRRAGPADGLAVESQRWDRGWQQHHQDHHDPHAGERRRDTEEGSPGSPLGSHPSRDLPYPVCANDTHDLAQPLSYSSWRRHQTPVSLRPLGARSSHWYMPQRPSNPRA